MFFLLWLNFRKASHHLTLIENCHMLKSYVLALGVVAVTELNNVRETSHYQTWYAITRHAIYVSLPYFFVEWL